MERARGVQALRSARNFSRPAPRDAAGSVFFRLQVLCNERSRAEKEVAVLDLRRQQIEQRLREIEREISELMGSVLGGDAATAATDGLVPARRRIPARVREVTLEY